MAFDTSTVTHSPITGRLAWDAIPMLHDPIIAATTTPRRLMVRITYVPRDTVRREFVGLECTPLIAHPG